MLMEKKMVLNSVFTSKDYFDPNNKQHVAIFKNFVETNTWGYKCCPFALEEPYLSIPDMIKDKLIRNYLKVNA
jgi:hypothetical protein